MRLRPAFLLRGMTAVAAGAQYCTMYFDYLGSSCAGFRAGLSAGLLYPGAPNTHANEPMTGTASSWLGPTNTSRQERGTSRQQEGTSAAGPYWRTWSAGRAG